MTTEQMTPEELKAKVTELLELLETQVTVNKGLGADLTKAKAELRKGQAIDPNDFANVQAEKDDYKIKLADADKLNKKLALERDNALKTLETESLITVNMQRERDLTEGLAGIKVTDSFNLKAAKAMLAAQVTVVTKDGIRLSMLGDKPISEGLKEWATTEDGQRCVAAPNNNGGGAQGGNTNPNSKTMTRANFDKADHAIRASFAKEGGKVVD